MSGNWLGSGQPSPYQKMQAVLSGAASFDDADPAIQSLLQKPIYDAAVVIVKESDRDKRRKMLTDTPESYRVKLEAEVRKIWPIRNKLSQYRSNTR